MNILHTSDWHLGVRLFEASLEEDHSLFLDWLLECIDERAIHALLISGDVFHFAQPSAAARRQLYDFLGRAMRCESLRKIVLTGGNHDSPSTLNAPVPLLDEARVTMVADASAAKESPSSLLVPLRDAAGTVAAVVAAIPYIHSWHLGVRTAEMTLAEEKAAIAQAFHDLYQTCADHAEKKYPGVPRLAMGHLTCGAPSRDDFTTSVHGVGVEAIGGIEGFGTNIFGDDYAYVALGHIHAHMPVADEVWYSGTPVATRFVEGKTPRKVRLITVSAGDVESTAITVPRFRNLVSLRGTREEVEAQMRTMKAEEPLAPYVSVEVHINDTPDSGLRASLASQLPDNARIVHFAQRRVVGDKESGDYAEAIPDVESVSLMDLFAKMYAERHDGSEPNEEIRHAFVHAIEAQRGASE